MAGKDYFFYSYCYSCEIFKYIVFASGSCNQNTQSCTRGVCRNTWVLLVPREQRSKFLSWARFRFVVELQSFLRTKVVQIFTFSESTPSGISLSNSSSAIRLSRVTNKVARYPSLSSNADKQVSFDNSSKRLYWPISRLRIIECRVEIGNKVERNVRLHEPFFFFILFIPDPSPKWILTRKHCATNDCLLIDVSVVRCVGTLQELS